MSVSINFKNDKFYLNRLNLPSRYYYFNECENYVKLLSIGEGIFPKDKIKTNIVLENSSAIFTTESATKVYPSKKEFGLNYISLTVKNSNCEFINDELILYKDSKFLQMLRVNIDEDSTLFFSDILTQGRSYEYFDFHSLFVRNKFYINKKLEYLENFEVFGENLKDYIKRAQSKNTIFLKLYIKTTNNQEFIKQLYSNDYFSFTFTKNEKLIIGCISSDNMYELKQIQKNIWVIYREFQNKNSFDLGKQ